MGTRRLTCQGATVAWILEPDEPWHGGQLGGREIEVEGLVLEGSAHLITALERFLGPDCLGFVAAAADPVPAGSVVLGDPGLVLCHAAAVEPGVVFDTRGGAVVVEAGAEVRHGSRLEGPVYVGERARVLGGPLRASVIGPRCSVRGEISSTVFQGYANKSHEGFVGHSVIGHWVNLGAGTTTSNLKNTYGEVSLDLGTTRLRTGRQFLGSLIGDHAKTAIGTMLSTGTVVGAGANLFGTAPGKFVPPLAWGSTSADRVTEAGFLQTAARVLPRRDVLITPEVEQSLRSLYRRLRDG
jgi:UDP-N-acetylglucosamine diphosphorylase/glucosamine-1-phosphate N-acetyltransferase